jgi:hypothetical protein
MMFRESSLCSPLFMEAETYRPRYPGTRIKAMKHPDHSVDFMCKDMEEKATQDGTNITHGSDTMIKS